jgi:hypothetical protein
LPPAERDVRAAENSTDWFLNYLAGIAVVELAEGGSAAPSVNVLTSARNFFQRARTDRPEFANAMARMASLELRSPGRSYGGHTHGPGAGDEHRAGPP